MGKGEKVRVETTMQSSNAEWRQSPSGQPPAGMNWPTRQEPPQQLPVSSCPSQEKHLESNSRSVSNGTTRPNKDRPCGMYNDMNNTLHPDFALAQLFTQMPAGDARLDASKKRAKTSASSANFITKIAHICMNPWPGTGSESHRSQPVRSH